MLIANAVHIWREPNGDHRVEWRTSQPDTEVTVEPLAAPGAVDQQRREARGGSLRISGLPRAGRHLFRVSDQHGNEVTLEQLLGEGPLVLFFYIKAKTTG